MKLCSKCKESKAPDEFHKNARRADGLHVWCKPCMHLAHIEYYGKNRSRKLALQKSYNRSNREKIRMSKVRRTYGVSEPQYRAILLSQDGKCANLACRSEVARGKGAFHVDHDHATGRVRGLLCHRCNVGIGHFADSPVRLTGAAGYLNGNKFDPGISSALLF